jgi:rhamnulose-1-phosphate aldolase
MKNMGQAPFIKAMTRACADMYRLGWDERNAGNLSLLLEERDLAPYLRRPRAVRVLSLGFNAAPLAGKAFAVTGTGKYFKNMEREPERNAGVLRISGTGLEAEVLWGFRDGALPTSELPAHLMSHIARLRADPLNRVITHCHASKLVAMTYVHSLDERAFTRTLWKMSVEAVIVFPDGVSVLPWMLCGTEAIGRATAEKMALSRLCIWAQHGVFGAGKTLDEAFGLIETAEKAASTYTTVMGSPILNTISDEQLRLLAETFNAPVRSGYLDPPIPSTTA